MEEINADKLFGYLRDLNPASLAVAYSNLFALGCYLHLQGQHEAGRRACNSMLDALGDNLRKTYFAKLMKALPGNEAKFACMLYADREIEQLFHDLPPRPSESE